MTKKILCSFLSLIMFLTASIPYCVYADELDVDNYLIAHGYPVQLINDMPEEEKLDLFNSDCYYESSKTYEYDENGKLIRITTPEDSNIIPYGQIKTSHLKLTITRSLEYSYSVITFNYKWNTLPVNRYQDPICVAWDSSVFSLVSESFRKVDQYRAVYPDNSSATYTATQSDEKSYAKATVDSVTWYADLKGYSEYVVELFGYGKFTLAPKKRNVNTQIFANYVHNKSAVSLSLTYIGGFTVSGSSPYDELGTDITIKS